MFRKEFIIVGLFFNVGFETAAVADETIYALIGPKDTHAAGIRKYDTHGAELAALGHAGNYMAVSGTEKIYVSDDREIYRYDSDGIYEREFFATVLPDERYAPVRATTFGPDGSLYVAVASGTFGTSRIERFDADGRSLGMFIPTMPWPAQSLVFDRIGNLFAATQFGVSKYDSNGTLLGIFETEQCLRDLAFDSRGNLYVTHYNFSDPILVYNVAGELIKSIDVGYAMRATSIAFDSHDIMYVGGSRGYPTIERFQADGTQLADFAAVQSIFSEFISDLTIVNRIPEPSSLALVFCATSIMAQLYRRRG